MRVVQITPGLTNESSGPSYSVPGLCAGLEAQGCDVQLHVLDGVPQRLANVPYSIVSHGYIRGPLKRLGISSRMRCSLCGLSRTADIMHTNGLWMMPNVYPALAKRGTNCKLVMAPRGALAAWSLRNHWLRKKVFGWCAQYAAMRLADMWHATCNKEYEEIRAAGYRQPVAVVPIGVDLPDIGEIPTGLHGGGKRRLVFFGRLHKVKAVENLIIAWREVSESFLDWELVIAGPDGGMRGELEELSAAHRIPRVSFVGELNGAEKYKFLASADLYVLPSYTENFAITVAEALACGTPVIASQGTPWQGLDKNKAGWWIPIGIKSLAYQLRESLCMSSDQLRQMGMNGRAWMERDFGWNAIGAKMKTAYEWIMKPSAMDLPECIKTN